MQVFGKRGQFQVEMNALAADHGLSKDFPEDVVAEAMSFSEELSKDEIAKRLAVDTRSVIPMHWDRVQSGDRTRRIRWRAGPTWELPPTRFRMGQASGSSVRSRQ